MKLSFSAQGSGSSGFGIVTPMRGRRPVGKPVGDLGLGGGVG